MLSRVGFNIAAASAITLVVAASCGPGETSDTPTSTPSQTPAATPSAPLAPAAAPLEVTSVLFLRSISDPQRQSYGEASPESEDFDRSIGFAGARLKLSGKSGQPVVVELYSEDTPDAKADPLESNRFYFRMPLQITDRQQLGGARFRMSLELNGAEETTNGIFLRGDQEQLQPIDLLVEFEVKDGVATISMRGLFKYVDVDAPQAGAKWFHVRGRFRANVE